MGFSSVECIYDTRTGGITGIAASTAGIITGLAVALWPARTALPSTGEFACDDR